jgi:hypothetical protein
LAAAGPAEEAAGGPVEFAVNGADYPYRMFEVNIRRFVHLIFSAVEGTEPDHEFPERGGTFLYPALKAAFLAAVALQKTVGVDEKGTVYGAGNLYRSFAITVYRLVIAVVVPIYLTGYFDEFLDRSAQGTVIVQVSGGNLFDFGPLHCLHEFLLILYTNPMDTGNYPPGKI